MLLTQQHPDYTYALRSADGHSAKVNEQILDQSLVLMPDKLIEDWPVTSAAALEPRHIDAVLELSPELVLLGTGRTQKFPQASVMAACLTRGIGIEVMSNDAAARTYSVLAGEGRRVAIALIFDTESQV